ncbi:MAG: hypothetical protein M1825_005745 [Sarcosagium campestre]|nr:MAG: hypothetical protein M1825_005745 [Sarcosagium campestre]
MAPRLWLQAHRIPRALPIRRRPSLQVAQLLPIRHNQSREYVDQAEKISGKDEEEPARGPNQDVLGHVSEEAAKTSEIMGESGPETDQGTPVQEILKRDRDAQKNAPNVIKQEISPAGKGTRSYGTLAQPSVDPTEVDVQGQKFGLPSLPLSSKAHMKYRYDPVVKQVTNLLMRDGKLSEAQKNMSIILQYLRTSSAPMASSRSLLPGAPPPNHLPLNPVLYLTLAIDSVAPLLKLRSQKGAAGGGVALQIPVPLRLRQRRKKAMEWILAVVDKKPSRGSGPGQFARKFAEEIVAVLEGRSAVWERRNIVHKSAVGARANLPRR